MKNGRAPSEEDVAAPSGAEVACLRTLRELDTLEADWNAAYALDTRAHLFVSFPWLRAWFEFCGDGWFVLAVRRDQQSPWSAMLPLKQRTERLAGVELLHTWEMGGKPISDYTGLICRPDDEPWAVPALGRWLAESNAWERLSLHDVMDDRLDALLAPLLETGLHLETASPNPAPWADIEVGSYDEYLERLDNKKNRYDMRRALRNIEETPGVKCSQATFDTLEAHVDVLMSLWQAHWGPRGPQFVAGYLHMFRRMLERNQLRLEVAWKDDQPMAAQATLLDPLRRTACLHLTTFDPAYKNLSPGKGLVVVSIRDAIERGFTRYDFLLGPEQYKYDLGGVHRESRSVNLSRRGWRNRLAPPLLGAGQALRDGRQRIGFALRRFLRKGSS